jgi:hypothetical protein
MTGLGARKTQIKGGFQPAHRGGTMNRLLRECAAVMIAGLLLVRLAAANPQDQSTGAAPAASETVVPRLVSPTA